MELVAGSPQKTKALSACTRSYVGQTDAYGKTCSPALGEQVISDASVIS